jgi:hypothetical protein
MTEDAMVRIMELMQNDYRLQLKRDALGTCSAELSRGWWPFKQRVHIQLNRFEFESAKKLLGDSMWRRVRRRPK